MTKYWGWVIVLFLLAACRQEQDVPVHFYYWKTHFTIGETEASYFRGCGSQKLYLRFFDVDLKNGEPEPVAVIKPFDPGQLEAEYIPVVFITNRVFRQQTKEAVSELADKVCGLIRRIEEGSSLPASGEVQIDCDWTTLTRDAYFHFLTVLKEKSGRRVSCTLRLHQIRDFAKTGVPPVEKGYLMCYATSAPEANTSVNSILDMSLLRGYTRDIRHYPLAFDIALPIYSWAVVRNHLDRIKLINGVTEKDLATEDFELLPDGSYKVLKDHFFKGMYLNEGFTMRVEGISPELLREARRYLDKQLEKPYALLYYHLDAAFLQRFTLEEIR